MKLVKNKKITIIVNSAVWDKYVSEYGDNARGRMLSDGMEKLRFTANPITAEKLNTDLNRVVDMGVREIIHGSISSPGYATSHEPQSTRTMPVASKMIIQKYLDSNGLGIHGSLNVRINEPAL